MEASIGGKKGSGAGPEPLIGNRQALSLGLHRREEDNVPDRIGVGEEHHQAVYPDAHAPRRRHADLKAGNKVLVEHIRLVVPSSLSRACCWKRSSWTMGSLSSE